MICGGGRSCENSIMENINSITAVSANNSLRNVTITSNLTANNNNNNNNNKLIVTISNTVNDREFRLYCSENDICKIRCFSKYGCKNFHLYCYGLCAIDCNNRSIDFNCPIIEYGINNSNVGYLPSLAPTYQPTIATNEPTKDPIEYPTFNPSGIPSLAPTKYPSIIPSGNPTLVPTVLPTMIPTDPTMMPTLIPTDHPVDVELIVANRKLDQMQYDLLIALLIICVVILCLTIGAWIDSKGCADRYNEQFKVFTFTDDSDTGDGNIIITHAQAYHVGDGPEFDETNRDRVGAEMKQHTIEMVTRGGADADSKMDHFEEYNNGGDGNNRDRYIGASAVEIPNLKPIHESRQISTSYDIPPEPHDSYGHSRNRIDSNTNMSPISDGDTVVIHNTPHLAEWAQGNIEANENWRINCNQDSMSDGGKGLLGLRLDGSSDVTLKCVRVPILYQHSQLGATFCGEYHWMDEEGEGGHFRRRTPSKQDFLVIIYKQYQLLQQQI